MKLLLAAAGLLLVVGCSSPYQAQPPSYMVNIAEERAELTANRSDLASKRNRLSNSKVKAEIEALEAEIAELEKRIAGRCADGDDVGAG